MGCSAGHRETLLPSSRECGESAVDTSQQPSLGGKGESQRQRGLSSYVKHKTVICPSGWVAKIRNAKYLRIDGRSCMKKSYQ